VLDVLLTMTGRPGVPLLMHNVRLASPMEKYAKKLAQLQEKRSKDRTDAERLQMARVEWEGGMYYDPDHGPCVTVFMVYASLIEGGRRLRKGTKVEQGVIINADGLNIPLHYDGPRTHDEMWEAGYHYTTSVAVGVGKNKARVDRCRPAFRNWSARVGLVLDDEELSLDDFERVVRVAGRVGMGDFRRFFGKYDVTVQTL
jgi:hypothetical protein